MGRTQHQASNLLTINAVFSTIYHQGVKIVGPLSAIPFLANAYLAYTSHTKGSTDKRTLYGAAAVGCISTIVFTVVFMIKGIDRLNAIAASSAEQEKVPVEVVQGLLRSWIGQNYVRAGLALAGGVASLTATLG